MLSDIEALRDIRSNIVLARTFVGELTADELAANIEKLYAVTRCLEIISEASRRLSLDLKGRHSELPWDDIAGAGNVYRHNYERVSVGILWKTVLLALPPLLAAIEVELSRLD